MNILMLFSGPSLMKQLNEVKEKEEEKGKVIFKKIIVINQADVLSTDDLGILCDEIMIVPSSGSHFKTVPYAFYYFCVTDGDSVSVAEFAAFLQKSSNPWKAFDDVSDLFRKSYLLS